jgi:S1-C subfamily serine protease
MKFRYSLLSIACLSGLLLFSSAYTYPSLQMSANPPVAVDFSPEQVSQLARSITVKVHADDSRGSGILIAKNGSTYLVITNAHVVDRGASYRITTPDGKVHTAKLKTKGDSWTGNDLALLQFHSSQQYAIAQIGDSAALSPSDRVFAAGFPEQNEQLAIANSNISLVADKPLVGGYRIGFTSQTQQGMSGGPLLNAEGKVIGVLGQGNVAILDTVYTYQDGSRPGKSVIGQMRNSSFAIPIATAVQMMAHRAI